MVFKIDSSQSINPIVDLPIVRLPLPRSKWTAELQFVSIFLAKENRQLMKRNKDVWRTVRPFTCIEPQSHALSDKIYLVEFLESALLSVMMMNEMNSSFLHNLC